MKKIITLTLSLSLVSIIAITTGSIVLAKEGESGGSGSSTTKITTTVKPTEVKKTGTEIEKTEVKETNKPNQTSSPKSTSENNNLNDTQKCEKINGNVNGLLQKYQNSKKENETKYGKTVEQLTKISTSLKNRGIDTSSLDSEISTLKIKVQKFSTDMDILINELKTFPDTRCKREKVKISETPKLTKTSEPKISKTEAPKNVLSESDDKLNSSLIKKIETGKLLNLRKYLANVKNDMDDIKNFYKDVVKPTILDLKKQLESITPSVKPSITITPTP